MHAGLSPEERKFQGEVRSFLETSLPQHLRDGMNATPSVFVEPDIGLEWQRILNEKGWLAYQWPVENGGTGWTPTERYIFEKECALADAPSLSVLGLKLVGPVIAQFGTPDQKERFLSRILSAEDLWCQGYSEPGSGSDLASLKTRAVRKGDRYIVNGSKIWTTHAHFADWMFCLARTDPDVKPQRGISFLLMRMKQPGVTIRPIIGLAGDHEVNQVFFDNAEGLVADRIGEEGEGWTIAKWLLENERGGSCAAPRLLVEISRLEAAAADQPGGIADDTEFARAVARARLEAEALELTELRLIADTAQGKRPGPQTSLIKLVASSLRQTIDELTLTAFGHDALQLPGERPLYGNESPEPIGSKAAQLAMPTYLNNRAFTIFGGSNEVQKNILAKTVLGL